MYICFLYMLLYIVKLFLLVLPHLFLCKLDLDGFFLYFDLRIQQRKLILPQSRILTSLNSHHFFDLLS